MCKLQSMMENMMNINIILLLNFDIIFGDINSGYCDKLFTLKKKNIASNFI